MDKSRYSKEIIQNLDILEENITTADARILEIAKELLAYAETTEDDTLKGYAAYYCGNAYYVNKMETEAINTLMQSIQWLNRVEEYRMVVRCYIVLALIFQYMGDYTKALDYYFGGLQIVQEYMLFREGASLLLNMSSLCEEAEDYENVLFYRNQCLEYFLQSPQDDIRDDYIIATSSMLLRLYNKLDRMEEAEQERERLASYIEQYGLLSCGFEVYINQLEYARKIKDDELEAYYLKKTEEAFNQKPNIVEYYDEWMSLIIYYREKGVYDKAEKVMLLMKEELNGDSYLEMYLAVLKQQVEIYREMQNMDEYVRALGEYYKVSCKLDKNKLTSVQSAIRLRVNLQQAKINNLFLKEQADTDAMTGLPNRRKINDKADQIFEDAYNNHLPLGVAMLDIDHFKYYNDQFGHKKGDDCIIAIANILKEMQDFNQFSARYGGDEFMLIFRNLEDKDILERCHYISQAVKAKGEELGVGELTVSIGVACWIPEGLNRIWDYNSVADETLYWVKEHGRNNYKLIHNLKEIKER